MKQLCIFIAVRCNHVSPSYKYKQLLPKKVWIIINELLFVIIIGYKREYIAMLEFLKIKREQQVSRI